MEMNKGNLLEKFGMFSDHWHPRIIAELNGQAVKIAKIKGEFEWHKHDNEDELFYVVKGEIKISLRDRELLLGEGEYVVIPKSVEHKPSSENESYILMFEPATTINTGDNESKLKKTELERI